MNPLCLSTGKAARALGVNADVIRRLCEADATQAEVTRGGQWRVPKDEIERRKAEGLPPVPKPLPAQPQNARTPAVTVPVVNGKHPGLLADPSDETVAAADEVVRLESEVRALALKRQREEALDWFRQREKEADEPEAAREAEELERERRQRMQDRWLEYALALIPLKAQGLHGKVKAAFANVDTDVRDAIVQRIVDGVIAALMRPWNRRREIEQVIEDAGSVLPYAARAWEERAREAAREAARAAVEKLGPEESIGAVRSAAAGGAAARCTWWLWTACAEPTVSSRNAEWCRRGRRTMPTVRQFTLIVGTGASGHHARPRRDHTN
jgi:hypothetical protein